MGAQRGPPTVNEPWWLWGYTLSVRLGGRDHVGPLAHAMARHLLDGLNHLASRLRFASGRADGAYLQELRPDECEKVLEPAGPHPLNPHCGRPRRLVRRRRWRLQRQPLGAPRCHDLL